MLLNAHCAHLTHRLNLVEVAKEVFDVTSVFNDMDASMIYSIKQAGVELKLQKWQSINMIASFILIVRMYLRSWSSWKSNLLKRPSLWCNCWKF
jgi:hypothetical protein